MANYTVGYHYTMRDVDGNSIVSSAYDKKEGDTATIANLVSASNAFGALVSPLTNAKVVQASVSILVLEAQGVGTDAEFPLVSQQAALNFSNSVGSRGRFTIPAPKESMFRAPPSDDIVDPTNADVAAFIAGYEAAFRDAGGTFLNLFQGGALHSRRRSRRRSIHS
jgi:hypothetical protein